MKIRVATWMLGLGAALGAAQFANAQQPQTPSQPPAQQPAPVVRHNPEIPTITVESRLVNVALNVVDETSCSCAWADD